MESGEDKLEELGAPKPAVQKVSYTHDAMIDMIVANPGISQRELAEKFGYTAPWVCQVIASDSFQARMAARKEELVDPVIRATLEEKMKALVARSIDILMEKLDKPSHTIQDGVVLKALELGAKGLGMGVKAPVVVAPASQDRLEQLGDNLVKLFRQKRGELYEGEAKDITPGEGE